MDTENRNQPQLELERNDAPARRSEPSPSHMDIAAAGPEIFAAISKAQSKAEQVLKDAKNTQRGYNYASADAIVAASRKPLTDQGLALFSSWEYREAEHVEGDIGRQFVSAHIRTHWVLSHSSGQVIRGFSDMPAIASPARPPDKAAAAASTYARGFILRDLLNLDRGGEVEDDVDRRDESQGWQPRTGNAQAARRGGPPPNEPPMVGTRTVVSKGDGKGETKSGSKSQPDKADKSKTKSKADVARETQAKVEQAHAEQAKREGKPDPNTPEGKARAAMVVEAKKYIAASKDAGRSPNMIAVASQAIGAPWDPNVIHTVDEYKAAGRELQLARETLEREIAEAARKAQDEAAEGSTVDVSDNLPSPQDVVDADDLPEPEGWES